MAPKGVPRDGKGRFLLVPALFFALFAWFFYVFLAVASEWALLEQQRASEQQVDHLTDQLRISLQKEQTLLMAASSLKRRVEELEQELEEQEKRHAHSLQKAMEGAAQANQQHPSPPRYPPPSYSHNGNFHPYQPHFNQMEPPPNPEEDKKHEQEAMAIDKISESWHHNPKGTIPIVIFTYKRADILKKMLTQMFSVLPEKGFVVYVSQDGGNFKDVTETIHEFVLSHNVRHMVHHRNVEGMTEEEKHKFRNPRRFEVYYAISHHYQDTIDKIFADDKEFDRVIVLEEDLTLAPDAFQFLNFASPLFDRDPSLYCVSLFNDNGRTEYVTDPNQVYRSDFFPGLGWMTSRKIWGELTVKWHTGFWDDWMRQSPQRKGRACVRPEVSRSYTYDRSGASAGQFGEVLRNIKLNDVTIEWAKRTPDFLIRDNYNEWQDGLIRTATLVRTIQEIKDLAGGRQGEFKFYYNGEAEWKRITSSLRLMTDTKEGIPRTAYRGIVTLRVGQARVHLISNSQLYSNDVETPPS